MARTICFYFMLVAPYPFFVILFPSLISSLTIYIHSIYSFWHFAGLPKVLKLCKLNNNIALYIHSIRSQLSSKYLVYYMFFYFFIIPTLNFLLYDVRRRFSFGNVAFVKLFAAANFAVRKIWSFLKEEFSISKKLYLDTIWK